MSSTARLRLAVLPVMLHPIHNVPVFLTSCTMQRSKYGFAYLALRAFVATCAGGADAEARALRDKILPRVVAASPNCASLHAELATCFAASQFLARVHAPDGAVVLIVRVPWATAPTSLPRSCTFHAQAITQDTDVAGAGVCLEMRVQEGGSASTYRALRFLPSDTAYVQAATLPQLAQGMVSSSGSGSAFLPHGTHYIVDGLVHDAVNGLTAALSCVAARPLPRKASAVPSTSTDGGRE